MAFVNRGDVIHHMQAVQACLPGFQAAARMELSGALEVWGRNRYFRFQPQFLRLEENGELQYWPTASRETVGFLGWLPYFNKRWTAAKGKLAFKEFCEQHSLPAPRHSRSSPEGMAAYLVKSNISTLGRGMRGPYRGEVRLNRAPDEGAYYEEFIQGRILKAHYWDAKLLCLEVQDPPTVTGDGERTIGKLIEAGFIRGRQKFRMQDFEDMIVFQGEKLKGVLEKGRALSVDFRYGANFVRTTDIYANVLANYEAGPIARQLREWGAVFLEAVPAELRQPGTAYTVDAMADDQDRVWLLEMNCNPNIHPDMYLGMFEGLFGPAEAPGAAPGAAGPADSPLVMTAAQPAPLMMAPRLAPQMPAAAPAPARAGDLSGLSRGELLALARAEMEAGRFDQALRKLKLLIAEPDPLVDALPLAGRIYAELRLSVEARDCYRRYLAIRPDALHEAFELGVVLFESGDLDGARRHWQELLKRAPTYAPTLFYSGLLAAREGQLPEARRHLEVLFQAAPADNRYVVRGRELLSDIDTQRTTQ